ncbi:TATA box-binding protein-like protein isoform 1 [Schistosoma japonicum]|uniref:TATA box-binding protein-like protein isoform 1 n=3 Tax=Schistosoma japonicum TaxID=6182 RepID=A0A4Z2DEC8_SCHJA|nr:TATA box-binding protein-like protein isoform 1 [Schistosoma japonicum]
MPSQISCNFYPHKTEMQTSELINGSTEAEGSSFMESTTDILDFLNTSDTENEDIVGNELEKSPEDDPCNEEASSLTLSITNVVVMASLQCHLRLKEIARTSVNVEYKALQNHVIMRLRSPYTVATIWSSGKIWCTGANSLAKAKIGARRIARRIAKCGFPCHFSKYRVVNIMATCKLPFGVRLEELVKERPMQMSYEPELAPGLTFKIDPNSSTSLKLFSTGRIVIMGSSLDSISSLVEELVPAAALHQTDEPIPNIIGQEYDDTRAAFKAAKYMHNMMSRDGGFSGLVYDEIDEEYASDDESDFYEDGTRNSFSTDDSTDSGASIDSGGVCTNKVKRRIKKKSQLSSIIGSHLHGYDSLQSMSPLHLLTPREAASLAFSRHATGDIEGAKDLVATAGELRRQRELLQRTNQNIMSSNIQTEARSNFLQTDPTWSRKAVASGSTKRACVVTYSGTEDSESQDVHNTVELRNQSHAQPTASLIEQQQLHSQIPSQQQHQVKIIHAPSVMPLNSTSHPVQVSTVMTPVNAANNSLQQYVLIKPSASINQPVYSNIIPAIHPTTINYTTSYMTPVQTNSIIRLTLPTLSTSNIDGQNSTIMTTTTSPATAYPIHLTNNTVMPNYISPNDGKMMTFAPGTTNTYTNHLIGFPSNTTPIFSNVYQIDSNSVVSGQTAPLVFGSPFITSFQPTSNNIIRPQLQTAAQDILSGSSNIFVSNFPNNITLKTTPVQTVGNLTSIPFTPTFTYQHPGGYS